jgi:hypothetical protein
MDTKNTHTAALKADSSGIPKAIETAIQRILRPLARLLLSFQITYPVFQQWLKHAYVEIAEKEFPLPDKPQTDTRISLLTGIHRKDIKRLRHEDPALNESPENISIGVQLAAHWMGQSEYLDQDKNPLALPFKAKAGEPSFERLVEQVCKKDIRARVVLDEWLRLEIVSQQENAEGTELLVLSPGAFVPSNSIDEKAFFLGMNVADHLATASHNVSNTRPSELDLISKDKFERCVYYDGLSESSIAELKQLAADQGMAFLHTLNERALQLKQQQLTTEQLTTEQLTTEQLTTETLEQGPYTQRINIGLYVFDESTHD